MSETCFASPQWFWLPKNGRNCLAGKKSAQYGELRRESTQELDATQLVEILGSGYRKRIDRAAKQWYLQVVHEDIERQLVKTAVKEMCNEWLHVLTEPVIAESKALDQRFREQAEKWAAETAHMSSPTQMMMHPSYQAVLGMAQENKREVIRLLILDLQEHRRTWFWALSYITHDNPINPSDAGKMGKMIDAWVKWGKAQGVI